MTNYGRPLARDWVLTLIIAGVPAIIVAVETGEVFLALAAFAAVAGIQRLLGGRASAIRHASEDRSPKEAVRPEASRLPPSEPIPIPRLRQWSHLLADRITAKWRRRKHRGFRMKADPRRCIHCHYDLTGLPDHHTCPECGRPYTFTDIDAYFDDPEVYRESRANER
ncbi:MAG: hypothetical protein KAV00_01065 [Phycisphaerae bacterium]|nr:hypothetical protein [Phycisphaerae bacterium]